MSDQKPKILHHHHVLAVMDATAMMKWWTEVMGFELWMEPDAWKFVRMGNCAIMLGECPDAIPVGDLGDHQYFAFFELDDVDAYYAAISDRCKGILSPPIDKPWGLREMHVQTPEGHRMVFGQDIET